MHVTVIFVLGGSHSKITNTSIYNKIDPSTSRLHRGHQQVPTMELSQSIALNRIIRSASWKGIECVLHTLLRTITFLFKSFTNHPRHLDQRFSLMDGEDKIVLLMDKPEYFIRVFNCGSDGERDPIEDAARCSSFVSYRGILELHNLRVERRERRPPPFEGLNIGIKPS